MSLNEVGFGTLPESVDHAGEGDGIGGSRSPFHSTKSPREGPAGMAGNSSFSCCAEQEFFPFSMGLETIGASEDATGNEALVPEPFDFPDFFRLLLVSFASIKLPSSTDSERTAILCKGNILSRTSASISLDFFKTSSANRSCR